MRMEALPIRSHFPRRRSSGLTLVELLMTISVIGLLAAIAIPQISSLANGEAQEARHRRNAQEIAAVCAGADAAGLNFIVPNDVEQTVRNVMSGGSPTDGPFKGKQFAVKGLEEEDVQGVKKYLSASNGGLSYNSSGNGSAAKLDP